MTIQYIGSTSYLLAFLYHLIAHEFVFEFLLKRDKRKASQPFVSVFNNRSVTLKLCHWNKNCILTQLDDTAKPVKTLKILLFESGNDPTFMLQGQFKLFL